LDSVLSRVVGRAGTAADTKKAIEVAACDALERSLIATLHQFGDLGVIALGLSFTAGHIN